MKRLPVALASGLVVAAAAAWSFHAPAAPGPTPPASPKRLVILAPALCESVFAIGAGDRVVGVSRYCDEPAAAAALPKVGGLIDPNNDAVASLLPDGVLLQGRSPNLEKLAQLQGWRVEQFTIECLADLFAAIERLGKLLDRETGARAEVARLGAALDAARAKAPSPRRRALISIGRTAGELGQVSSIGNGTFLGECLAAAGADNAFQDLPRGYPLLSKEAIAERRPELVIELQPSPVAPEVAARLAKDWEALPGFAPRVAVIAGSETLIPGPRLARLVERFSRAVRGERDP